MNGARVLAFLTELLLRMQVRFAPIARRIDWHIIRTSALVLSLSFVIASSFSTYAANFALNLVGNRSKTKTEAGGLPFGVGGAAGTLTMDNVQSSAGQLRKSILGRNVFNSEGTLAPEPEDTGGGRTGQTIADFERVQCTMGQKLPVDIMGSIVDSSDPSHNVVVLKDPKVPESDIYRKGELIIDHDEYEIYAIRKGLLEVRKGDQKLCINLDNQKPQAGAQSPGAAGAGGGPLVASAENTENITLDSNYMSEQFKNGGQPILDSAKLIPEIEAGNKVPGFKVIGIRPGSIFDKLKLQNGDIIAEVNGVSLRDPSKGYELYRALQEEREINIGFTRGGEPMNRKVQVK